MEVGKRSLTTDTAQYHQQKSLFDRAADGIQVPTAENENTVESTDKNEQTAEQSRWLLKEGQMMEEIERKNKTIKKLNGQVQRMELENAVLRKTLVTKRKGLAQRRRRERHHKKLMKQKLSETQAETRFQAGQMCSILSVKQMKSAVTKKRVTWDPADVAMAVGLRSVSKKGYEFVRGIMHIPLPSPSTMARWSRYFRVTPGPELMDASVQAIQATVPNMPEKDRIAVICFDEMCVDGRYCYDQATDQVGL